MSIFVAGLDLGQARDYSALVILEGRGTLRKVEWEARDAILGLPGMERCEVEVLPVSGMDVRHIERFKLGTKYKQIASEVGARMRHIPQPRYLAVDETGVGVAVTELLAPLNPHGITITAGSEVTIVAPMKLRVPKRDLVAALQVGLQAGMLRIANGLPRAELLVREMLAFRARISEAGHDTYEAWREQEHDDLVLAAAMAAWMVEQAFRVRQAEIEEELLRRRLAVVGVGGISAI